MDCIGSGRLVSAGLADCILEDTISQTASGLYSLRAINGGEVIRPGESGGFPLSYAEKVPSGPCMVLGDSLCEGRGIEEAAQEASATGG